MKSVAQSTIAALSTPPGAGGIAIIRLSGPEAHTIVRRVFHPWPENPEFFHFYLGHIHPPDGPGRLLDQVFLVLMPEGRSYTREPLAEIHCHGGIYVTRKILSLFYELGAEAAAPGEFTRRAFLNGRLDLAQAEAVAGLIAAESEAGLRAAAAQLKGSLSQRIEELLSRLDRLLAGVESELDLLAEEGENYQQPELPARLAELRDSGRQLCAARKQGRFCQSGLKVVLAGRPNVGKSSLLNALLAEDRALVSSVSGTTRDVVSAALELAGIRIELADTAGLDEPRDELEALGMARTNEWLEKADLILLLLDRSRPLSKNDIELYEKISSRPHLLLLNKVDLPAAFSSAELSCRLRCSDLPIACVARRGRAEIEDLRQALSDFVAKAVAKSENAAVILNQRHYERLAAFVAALERALALSENRIQLDLLAEELQQARQALLEILGREQAAVETLLDVVFEQFCIGK
jgi:tRNA modification GTPase